MPLWSWYSSWLRPQRAGLSHWQPVCDQPHALTDLQCDAGKHRMPYDGPPSRHALCPCRLQSSGPREKTYAAPTMRAHPPTLHDPGLENDRLLQRPCPDNCTSPIPATGPPWSELASSLLTISDLGRTQYTTSFFASCDGSVKGTTSFREATRRVWLTPCGGPHGCFWMRAAA